MNKKLNPVVVVAVCLVAVGCIFAVMWIATESPTKDKPEMPNFAAMGGPPAMGGQPGKAKAPATKKPSKENVSSPTERSKAVTPAKGTAAK